jgi:hypothetical protein
MTEQECKAIVLRMSGVLWAEFKGHLNKWDGLAIRLLRDAPKRRKAAFNFFHREQLPLPLAETVWEFISQLRAGGAEMQELLEQLAQYGG